MKPVAELLAATAELEQAVAWYEERELALAKDFMWLFKKPGCLFAEIHRRVHLSITELENGACVSFPTRLFIAICQTKL